MSFNIALLLLLSSYTGLWQIYGTKSEKDLVKALFEKYDKRVRPVRNYLDIVDIIIQPQIYSLIRVDELKEQITLLLWLPQGWTDPHLQWNETEWNGIRLINMPAAEIWIPDGAFFDTVDAKETTPLSQTYAKIYSSGYVELDLNKLVDVKCPLDVSDFPFDMQSCGLRYGSWGFQEDQINYTIKNPMSLINETSEWNIISFDAVTEHTKYESVSGLFYNRYQEILYTLKLRRKPLFYIVVLLAPTYVIVTVSIVGLFIAHTADGDREEKVTFGLTTLLTMAVVLDMVTGEMPKSSSGLPLLGKYIIVETVISVAATLVAGMVMFWNQRVLMYDIEPPKWIRDKFSKKKQLLKSDISEMPLLDSFSKNDSQQLQTKSLATKNAELVELMKKICEYYDDLLKDDRNKTIWRRFFSFVDNTSLAFFVIFNTVLTVFTFRSVLF